VSMILVPIKFPPALAHQARIAAAVQGISRSEFVRRAVKSRIRQLDVSQQILDIQYPQEVAGDTRHDDSPISQPE
jgi:hypothetical protein